jgi:transcriptional regulator with XRE-family HTH domain
VTLAARVAAELDRRRQVNPRSSLRALARRIGVSHSVLSRLCRGRSRPSRATTAALASALGLTPAAAHDATLTHAVDRLCALAARPGFRADARWIAVRLGLRLDDVQLALHDALRRGRLRMTSPATWRALEAPWEIPSSAGRS